MERRRLHLASTAFCLLALGSCGGGERQDEDESEGSYRVQVVESEFPTDQRLAKRSELRIKVRNAGSETIPNVAVSLDGFGERRRNRELADPTRPVFVINGAPREIGTYAEAKERVPGAGDTAYVGTWALGRLPPGRAKTFLWNVTAVRAGPFRVEYRVSAGLDGKARAVTATGRPARGLFIGTIDDRAPDTRVAEDGRTVVEGLR